MWYEVPPTAGLPLAWSDLVPSGLQLESALAEIVGVQKENIVVASSGTACLLAALTTLKSKSSRRNVIVSGYTCPLVALAIAQAGLNIVLCDVTSDRLDSFDMDNNQLKRLCNSDTLCVIATHLGGLPCDIETIVPIAKQVGAYVIEDAAQALGASLNGQSVGTFGDIGVFSLTRGKGLTIYEGGFLFAGDASLLEELVETINRLQVCDKTSESIEESTKVAQLLGYAHLYNPVGLSLVYGSPLRSALAANDIVKAVGDDLAGAIRVNPVGPYRKSIGAKASTRFAAFLNSNQRRAKGRISRLRTLNIEGLSVIEETEGSSGSWPFISITCPSQTWRDNALERLWTSGLGVTRLFARDLAGYDYLGEVVAKVDVPNSKRLAARSFTISNSHWLTDEKFELVLACLQKVPHKIESLPIA